MPCTKLFDIVIDVNYRCDNDDLFIDDQNVVHQFMIIFMNKVYQKSFFVILLSNFGSSIRTVKLHGSLIMFFL